MFNLISDKIIALCYIMFELVGCIYWAVYYFVFGWRMIETIV